MNSLEHQRERLESEIAVAKANIQTIRESDFPDLKALHQHAESIERNMQLIGMIDNHLDCDHQPMRKRK